MKKILFIFLLIPQIVLCQQITWVRDIEHDTLKITKALQKNVPIDPDFNTNRQFTLVGKDAHFAFSVGAQVRMTGMVDFNHLTSMEGNYPAHIPEAEGNDVNISLGSSNIVFNFVSQPKPKHTIGAFIGIEFQPDNSYMPQLDHAYMKYNNLTIGSTYTTYNDHISSLFTIDGAAPVASGNASTLLIRWEPYIQDWRFGIGVEQVRRSYTYANPDSLVGIDQRIPDVPVYVSYEPSERWHIRLSGVLRGLEYEKAQGRAVAFGWGVKLTGHLNLKPVNLFWMVQAGRGSASFQSANRNEGLDLIPVIKDGEIEMTSPLAAGASLGMRIQWTPKLCSAIQGSVLKNHIPAFTDIGNSYARKNALLANANANLVWNIYKLVSLGAEYSFAYRYTTSHTTLLNHRVLAMIYVSF